MSPFLPPFLLCKSLKFLFHLQIALLKSLKNWFHFSFCVIYRLKIGRSPIWSLEQLLWLFARSLYLAGAGVPGQALILQVTIVVKPQWLQLLQLQLSIHGLFSALQLSVAANLLIMMTLDLCTGPAWKYIKPRYLTSYSRKQWTSKAERYFQGMFSKPPVNCSLNLETYIVPSWREISVDYSSSIFFSYFLNSHKLLTSPASCGNELHSFNCILCEVSFFLLCFLKSVICSFHLIPLNPCIWRKMNNCPLCTFHCSIDFIDLYHVFFIYLYSKWRSLNLLSPSSCRNSSLPF